MSNATGEALMGFRFHGPSEALRLLLACEILAVTFHRSGLCINVGAWFLIIGGILLW